MLNKDIKLVVNLTYGTELNLNFDFLQIEDHTNIYVNTIQPTCGAK